MGELVNFVNEVQYNLSMQGNFGSGTMKKFYPSARLLSEKYILDHVYDQFFALFKKKHGQRDILFKAKTDITRSKPP